MRGAWSIGTAVGRDRVGDPASARILPPVVGVTLCGRLRANGRPRSGLVWGSARCELPRSGLPVCG